MSKNQKVYVGMSGGVDSSVTAALLKEQGFDVTGVFIKAWHPEGMPCDWKEDRRDAMRVAAALDIPFKTLDLEKEYKQDVVDYMIAEYKKGRTPNPDVMCNKYVKFRGFLDFALREGADFIATGHYARLREIKDQKSKIKKIEMLEAKDKAKDQSYFLWTLTQEQLKHVLFPVGEYEKYQVRKLAERFSLPTASKKDSQGLCFIGKVDIKDFLRDHINPVGGNILNEQGEVIGTHEGVNLYTIGERHGFTITKKTTYEKPLYVVTKDISRNTITVSEKHINDSKNLVSNIEISSINWIIKPQENKEYDARFRYHQTPEKCTLVFKDDKILVTFKKPQAGIAEGQSLVLYDEEICLGGGVIEFAR